jgi:CheY-like chemotaxis protein
MSDGGAKRVLLVEDDDENAEAYTDWLKAQGYGVERASAAEEGVQVAEAFKPDVVVLDLQLPSKPGRTDERTEHGFRVLDELLKTDPFRPIVVASAHSKDRELMRQVMQRNRGGHFVFKDDKDLRAALIKAVAVALESPAYVASTTVRAFEALIERTPGEEEIRTFLRKNWRTIVGPRYRECHSPYPIDRGLKVDLLFMRHDGFPDIWELKRPDQPVFKTYNDRMHHSTECARAVGQLMEYIDLAEKQTGGELSFEARTGFAGSLHRPRGVVVIGRRASRWERDRLALDNSFMAGITILTYDDLIEGAREILTFLRDYRNGSVEG